MLQKRLTRDTLKVWIKWGWTWSGRRRIVVCRLFPLSFTRDGDIDNFANGEAMQIFRTDAMYVQFVYIIINFYIARNVIRTSSITIKLFLFVSPFISSPSPSSRNAMLEAYCRHDTHLLTSIAIKLRNMRGLRIVRCRLQSWWQPKMRNFKVNGVSRMRPRHLNDVCETSV